MHGPARRGHAPLTTPMYPRPPATAPHRQYPVGLLYDWHVVRAACQAIDGALRVPGYRDYQRSPWHITLHVGAFPAETLLALTDRTVEDHYLAMLKEVPRHAATRCTPLTAP